MNIGSYGSTSYSYSGFSLKVNNTNSAATSDLKKLLTASTSQNSATAKPSVTGTPDKGSSEAQQAPKEITKSELEDLKNKIIANGGQGADKIDDLIKNFDQYDTAQTGSISIEAFKQYAQQNGVDVPKHQHHHHHRPSPGAILPTATAGNSDSGDTDSSSSSASKAAVANVLSKYAGSVDISQQSPASETTATTDTTQATTAVTPPANSDTTNTQETQKTTAELKSEAASGDSAAQKELARREAASSGADNTSLNVAA